MITVIDRATNRRMVIQRRYYNSSQHVVLGANIPALWNGETFLIACPGPSFRVEDVDLFMNRARVIAVADAVQAVLWADVCYAYHAELFWGKHEGLPSFRGLKFGMEDGVQRWPGVRKVVSTGAWGIETQHPDAVRHGHNSGATALGIAVHLGAKRVALLGVDCKERLDGGKHFYDDTNNDLSRNFKLWKAGWASMAGPAYDLGIEIINCSRDTDLHCFDQMTPEEFLAST